MTLNSVLLIKLSTKNSNINLQNIYRKVPKEEQFNVYK